MSAVLMTSAEVDARRWQVQDVRESLESGLRDAGLWGLEIRLAVWRLLDVERQLTGLAGELRANEERGCRARCRAS